MRIRPLLLPYSPGKHIEQDFIVPNLNFEMTSICFVKNMISEIFLLCNAL